MSDLRQPGDVAIDLAAIEQAVVRGWPAFETEAIDGWLARFASGGSVRANSVAALAWSGADVEAAVARVVAFYRARGGMPRFTVSEASRPAGLDAVLERAGWRRSDEHVTMAKDIAAAMAPAAAPGIDVRLIESPTPAWQDVYLQGLTETRRTVAMRLVAGVPSPRQLFLAHRDGVAIACGLSVVDGALASVQCMATLPSARRTGAATAVLAAIEASAARHGARRLYLQADAHNAAAIGTYGRYGFSVIGRYHTRDLTGGG